MADRNVEVVDGFYAATDRGDLDAAMEAFAPDAEWHQLKVTLAGGDVVLHRDGVEAVRKAHGLPLDRANLTLGSPMDKRSREPFECHLGRVLVRREPLQ